MILAIANQKGGVGKTTTAINLGAALALRGHRTVLIDLDPQANTTMSYVDMAGVTRSLFDALTEPTCAVADIIIPTPVERLSIIPSRIGLAKLEAKLVGEMDAHFRLKDKLEPITKTHDVILIDCPPALGLLTVNALVAATHLLIPIQSSYFALEGTDDLLETVEKVRSRANPGLEIMGVLITMHDKRTSLARDIRPDPEGVRVQGLQHGHHQERPARGKPGLQGIHFHVRSRLQRGDRVLLVVRGGHGTCLGAACRKRCGCVTTSTTSRRWRRLQGLPSDAWSRSSRSTRTRRSRAR